MNDAPVTHVRLLVCTYCHTVFADLGDGYVFGSTCGITFNRHQMVPIAFSSNGIGVIATADIRAAR
jgi:hypothetical protein